MAKAHFVKKARRPVPEANINVGGSYYWWAFMSGGRGGAKRYSLTPPKQSQLTQSEFWSAVYSLQERPAPSDLDDVECEIEDLRSELESIMDETQSKLDNMPEGLQQGDSGQLLQERIDACENAISELDSVDFSFDEPDTEGMDETETEEAISQAREDRLIEVWSEVGSAIELSCS